MEAHEGEMYVAGVEDEATLRRLLDSVETIFPELAAALRERAGIADEDGAPHE